MSKVLNALKRRGRLLLRRPPRREVERRRWSERSPDLDVEMELGRLRCEFSNPREVYRYAHHYYVHRCPQIVREHRQYFSEHRRGFGEDAMHAMWWWIFLEHKPLRCLEIGVYRGQIISLWSLIARYLRIPCEVSGVSPFTSHGDSQSNYMELDYHADVLKNFEALEVPRPALVRALSTEPAGKEYIASRTWDLVYVDGGHDYEVVLSDYEMAKQHLRPGGLLVLDDSALHVDYDPPSFAFAGHPGPSRVAADHALKELEFIVGVGHNLVFQKGSTPDRGNKEVSGTSVRR